jgi:hypothetical protein
MSRKYIIELSFPEVRALQVVLNRVGGHPETTLRGRIDRVAKALQAHGPKPDDFSREWWGMSADDFNREWWGMSADGASDESDLFEIGCKDFVYFKDGTSGHFGEEE